MPKISNPPQTEDPNLNFILLEIIRELNLTQENHLKLLADIRAASDLADLKERIDKK
tara:strand:- start:2426 stop:2596 length:171 start_codon:yes stop_codon:yes gene_type:complete